MPKRVARVVPGVTDEDPNTGRRIKKRKKSVRRTITKAAAAVKRVASKRRRKP